jgi:glycolate oxidase
LYTQLTATHIEALKALLGHEALVLDPEQLNIYSRDYTEDFSFLPELVVKATNSNMVSQLAKYCHEHRIALTCRGAGTGLSGACLPIEGGIVLSLEKMNKILAIDTVNHQAIVEPGVINDQLQQAVQDQGLFTLLTQPVKAVAHWVAI